LIVAADSRAKRVALLAEAVAASGTRVVRILMADLARPLPFRRSFDRVLVDAPCSGLGTIRRDPEIRWRRSEADLERFASAQIVMLAHAAEVVSPGGRLVYATCSSEPDENEAVVEAFLGMHPEFVAADPRATDKGLPAGLEAVLDASGRLRTSPHLHGLEAFFAAVLLRDGNVAQARKVRDTGLQTHADPPEPDAF
jgi:16S rRNA (cytosine967-C5)-methyltransferase